MAQLYATNSGLNAEASIIADGFTGLGADVYPRLHFQVNLLVAKAIDWHRKNEIQAWSFGMLSGHLLIGSEKFADITPQSVNSWLWGELTEDEARRNAPVSREVTVTIEAPLTQRAIEWIEAKRAGKSFQTILRMDVEVHAFGKNTFTPSFATGLLESLHIWGDVPIAITDTQWRERVLPGLGYGKRIVMELPAIERSAYQALDHSFKALEKAQRLFELGLYDDTVAACRVALDQFFEIREDETGKKIPRLKQSWETRLGKATHEWLDAALSAVKGAANKPHHSPERHFSRLGAQSLMMVTAALVSYAAQYCSAQVEN